MDRLLDQPQRYQLHAFVVMPNHVHLLVSPAVTTQQWLGPLKGFTAHQANRILGRHGPFWQDQSYAHLIRDDREFQRVQRYIEQNPVRAGLVVRRRAGARRQAKSLTPLKQRSSPTEM